MSGFFYKPEELIKDASPHVRETPILLTHGYGDEILPYETTKGQVDFVGPSLGQLEFHGLTKAHTIINFEFELIQEWYYRIARSKKRIPGD